MDPDRWERVQDLYLEALERPASGRARWLEAACGGDSELRREVEELLVAAGGGDPVLDATLDDLVLLVEPEEGGDAPPLAPLRAGPWAVEEEIGRGGMSTVYRARRADGEYAREVALKVIHPAGHPEEVARRVRRERRILASLEHPCIARFYDSGVLEDGRPWLAMELVRGEPIQAWCDRRRLTVPQRLALFEQVVAAVDHAHRKLVIHRDLKPSNILVTEAGEVKLLDFGIARLLDPGGEEGEGASPPAGPGGVHGDAPVPEEDREPLTRHDQRILTPEYASPEQLRGEPLSTATDIYSLGVLLHHLLVGRRPEGSPATLPSAQRDTEGAAAARSTTPPLLRRQLRGELDTLVLKALRPEPEGRYPSAAALLDDLVRYRSGRPITARPASFAYRARKFAGRNRGSVTAGTVALLGLVGGLVLAVQQGRVARMERDAAREVTTFLEGLFTATDPFRASAERLDTLRIGAFLERGANRLEADLADRPELRTRMQEILGSAFRGVGEHGRSRELLESALEGYRDRTGEGSPEVIRTLEALGLLLHQAGDPVTAEARFREALALAADGDGVDPSQVARLRSGLAPVLLSQDRLDEAAELLGEATAVPVEEGDVTAAVRTASDLNLLASLRFRQGRLDEAIEGIRQGVEVASAALGDSHPGTAILTHNLGMALHRRGRLEEAEGALRLAVDRLRRALGPDHPQVGFATGALANVLEASGRWEEADPLYAEGLAFTRRNASGPSQDLSIALHDYGGALLRRGELERAAPLLEEALRVEREVLGPRSPGSGILLAALGELRRRQGSPQASEELYRESLDILGAVFPSGHPRILATRSGLGLTLGAAGRTGEGEALLLEVLREAEALPDGGVAARDAARSLARFHEAAGNADQAAGWLERAEAAAGGAGPEGAGAGVPVTPPASASTTGSPR